MRKLFIWLVAPALLALPARATAGELKLSINHGLVTLTAEGVPLSMVLAEWARVGQTKIVNGEKMLAPVSLHLVNVPERKALDIILRTASGYMAAERPTALANASAFDRIMILPTSRPPANTGPVNTPQPFNAAPQPFNNVPRPMPMQQPIPDMDDEGPNGLDPNIPSPNAPGSFPANQPGNIPSPNPPGTTITPGQPGQPQLTLPRPGQLPQPAPQQPVPFGAPPKPPGGGGGGQG